MQESKIIDCLQRHQKRRGNVHATLSMVSLMDIFTILVFFLLVSSADSEVLPSPKSISLPKSVAEQSPKQTLILMVNQDDLTINGKHIVRITPQLIASELALIPELESALGHYAVLEEKNKNKEKSFAITIMGDKEIEYRLLKKIMLTCAKSKYGNISLAVIKKQAKRS